MFSIIRHIHHVITTCVGTCIANLYANLHTSWLHVGVAVVCGTVACQVIAEEPLRREIQRPKVSFNYAHIELPAHFTKYADLLDNTPADNPLTDAGATLGRVLFYDKALSQNGAKSCASCHRQEFAFTDIDRFSTGFAGEKVDRNSMSLVNLRYYPRNKFFWDERADGLEAQVLQPITNPVEMGRRMDEVISQLQSDKLYTPLFIDAFGDQHVTETRIANALAQFVRSIVSYSSKYDMGLASARNVMEPFSCFTAEENRGKQLFFGVARCATCHVVQVPPHELSQFTGPTTGKEYYSTSDIEVELDRLTQQGWHQTAFFFMAQPLVNGIDGSLDKSDWGAGKLDLDQRRAGFFKSPSLRNVAVTAPYMHDGRLSTLEAVMEHYNWSVRPHPNLDFRIADLPARGLAFPQTDVDAIVAFLKTLTDEKFLSDEKYADPFVSH